jgi:hypothetical protein
MRLPSARLPIDLLGSRRERREHRFDCRDLLQRGVIHYESERKASSAIISAPIQGVTTGTGASVSRGPSEDRSSGLVSTQVGWCSKLLMLQNLFCTSCLIPRFDLGLVVQNYIQQGIMDFQFSVILDKTQFTEFVHEKAYA